MFYFHLVGSHFDSLCIYRVNFLYDFYVFANKYYYFPFSSIFNWKIVFPLFFSFSIVSRWIFVFRGGEVILKIIFMCDMNQKLKVKYYKNLFICIIKKTALQSPNNPFFMNVSEAGYVWISFWHFLVLLMLCQIALRIKKKNEERRGWAKKRQMMQTLSKRKEQ